MNRKEEKIHVELTGRLTFVSVEGGTQLVLTKDEYDYADLYDILTADGWNPRNTEGRKVTLYLIEED